MIILPKYLLLLLTIREVLLLTNGDLEVPYFIKGCGGFRIGQVLNLIVNNYAAADGIIQMEATDGKTCQRGMDLSPYDRPMHTNFYYTHPSLAQYNNKIAFAMGNGGSWARVDWVDIPSYAPRNEDLLYQYMAADDFRFDFYINTSGILQFNSNYRAASADCILVTEKNHLKHYWWTLDGEYFDPQKECPKDNPTKPSPPHWVIRQSADPSRTHFNDQQDQNQPQNPCDNTIAYKCPNGEILHDGEQVTEGCVGIVCANNNLIYAPEPVPTGCIHDYCKKGQPHEQQRRRNDQEDNQEPNDQNDNGQQEVDQN